MRRAVHVAGALAPVLLAACADAHHQSALHPAGPAAARIADLTWLLVGVLTAVFVATLGLALVALLRPAGPPRPEVGTRFVVAAGAVIPGVVLVGILFVALDATVAVRGTDASLTVRITGHQWWWEVAYPEHGVVTANELVLPAGTPVRLELLAADVIHSVWIPNLHGKMDMIPERTNVLQVEASSPGRWRGVCAEYCGTQHAWMAFPVEALPPEAFAAWIDDRRAPPASATAPPGDLARGRDLFVERGCGACHRVASVSSGAQGPDLTHLASRTTLGAGAAPNTPEALAAWIRDPQGVKPGNLMPATALSDDELAAVVAWLGSLR